VTSRADASGSRGSAPAGSGARGGGPPDRTALSWQRSLLSVAFVGAFVAAAAVRLEVSWVAVAAGLVALASVGVAIAGRPREVREGQEEVSPWPWLPRITIATAVVGLLGASLGIVEVARRVL